jgi:hypothetical protein
MSNNKQQTAVEWLSNQSYELFEQYSEGQFDRITLNILMLSATAEAKEMYQDEIEAAIIKQCAEESTSEASIYSDGYKQGYNRAIELTKWAISNLVPPHYEQG